MNKKRLLKLAAFLRKLPAEKFNINDVVTRWDNNCGSICCAMGWTPKVFPKLIQWTPNGPYKLKLCREAEGEHFDEVAVKLFKISFFQVSCLFGPGYYDGNVTPCMVAERIDNLWKTINMTFNKQTKTQQRILIAKDVLERLDKKNYIAKSSVWVKFPASQEEVDKRLQVCDILDQKKCECCALGSILLSEISFNDHYTLKGGDSFNKDTFFISLDDRQQELLKIFSRYQLVLIEIAFENGMGNYRFHNLPNNQKYRKLYQNAIDFYDIYPEVEARLRAIMNNIIRNKGTFIPSDL